MPQERLPKQTLLAKVKGKKAGGTTTNTLGRLHWESWMKPHAVSTKRNVRGDGGPWYVAAQPWTCCPRNPHGHERARKEEDIIAFLLNSRVVSFLSKNNCVDVIY